jgi:para-nitrobenzyl esterase
VQKNGDGEEDCLYLHVHAPERVANGSVTGPVPVMVYIHGGGLMDGGGQFEHLDPLAAHMGPDGVVVVAINYRLNIFGWLTVTELSEESPTGTSGNYGLLDQQLALQWVQTNVARFGGDPDRVTVAGQSSGGTSIFALLGSPASQGLFSRNRPERVHQHVYVPRARARRKRPRGGSRGLQ